MSTVVIKPTKGWVRLGLGDLWTYRELLYFLVWRDVKVRYKQTALGAAWALIQPFMLMIVFSIFLGKLAKVPSDGLPYPVFAYAALVPWTLFAQSLAGASNSLVGSSNLISKVYFPRLALPLAAVGSFLIDFVIAMALLIAMMFYYGITPGIEIFWTIPLTLLALLASLSVGVWLAALNVRYRDVIYAIPFLIQLWLFASPVAYPSSIVPIAWRGLYGLNPMAGVVEGFRWALLGTNTKPGGLVLVSGLTSFVVLIAGLAFFKRTEKTFADVI